MAAAITVTHVSKTYRRYKRRHQSLKEIIAQRSFGEWEDFWALKDVSFEVQHGQFLGVIGHNGSGKSTLLKLLTGIMPPAEGEIAIQGRVASLLELGAGFQAEYTGRENVYLYGTLLGMRRRDIDRYYDSIVEFCELGDFMETAVKNYSSGMYVRLGFAVAVHLDPEILLIDEVLAVGDANFQRKCFEHLFRLRKRGCTIVLVTHDMVSVERFCEHAIWLDHGKMLAQGKSTTVVQAYLDSLSVGASLQKSALSEEERQALKYLRLTSLRYLNEAGRPANIFDTGSAVRVELSFEATRRLDRLEVGFTAFREDGVRAFDASLYGVGVEAGPGKWVLDIPRLDLQGGRYEATVAVYDRARRRYHDLHERQHPFTIHDDYSSAGLFYVEHKWSLETPEGLQPLESVPPELAELRGFA